MSTGDIKTFFYRQGRQLSLWKHRCTHVVARKHALRSRLCFWLCSIHMRRVCDSTPGSKYACEWVAHREIAIKLAALQCNRDLVRKQHIYTFYRTTRYLDAIFTPQLRLYSTSSSEIRVKILSPRYIRKSFLSLHMHVRAQCCLNSLLSALVHSKHEKKMWIETMDLYSSAVQCCKTLLNWIRSATNEILSSFHKLKLHASQSRSHGLSQWYSLQNFLILQYMSYTFCSLLLPLLLVMTGSDISNIDFWLPDQKRISITA